MNTFFEQYLDIFPKNNKSGFLCCINPLLLKKETNYYEDILQFCLNNDVFNRLGMNLNDIMHLDLVTYKKLRDIIRSTPKQESKELKKVIDELKL